jgi:hypothetical protein
MKDDGRFEDSTAGERDELMGRMDANEIDSVRRPDIPEPVLKTRDLPEHVSLELGKPEEFHPELQKLVDNFPSRMKKRTPAPSPQLSQAGEHVLLCPALAM